MRQYLKECGIIIMAGMDFTNTIVIMRVINRGTKIIKETVKPQGLFGEDAKKKDLKRLKVVKDLRISIAKGTKSIKASELPETKSPDVKGHYITTGRGTGRMKME